MSHENAFLLTCALPFIILAVWLLLVLAFVGIGFILPESWFKNLPPVDTSPNPMDDVHGRNNGVHDGRWHWCD